MENKILDESNEVNEKKEELINKERENKNIDLIFPEIFDEMEIQKSDKNTEKEISEENKDKKETRSKRNYGIDLLRIVTMYLICILHILGQGGVLEGAEAQSANYFIAWFLEIIAYCAVDCYALISGYVGIGGKYKYSNIIYLWLQVEFYSLGIFFLFSIINHEFSKEQFLNQIFPITYERYWYFLAYFGLFLVKPYLDYSINNIPKNIVKYNIFFSLIIIMIFARLNDDFIYLKNGYSPYWLIILYIVGGYIKKYEPFKKIKKIWLILIWIFSIIITWIIKLSIELSSKNDPDNNGEVKNGDFFISYLSVTIFVVSVAMLELFSRITFDNKPKIIEILSVSSFGVYIIHEHKNCLALFENKFSPYANYNPILLILSTIGTALAFYFGCSIIDYLRYLLFELIRLRKILVKLEGKFNKRFIET